MKIISLVIGVLLSLYGTAGVDSSYIDINRVKYSSDFERSQFISLGRTGAFDPLNFLLCLDSTATEVKAENLRIKLNRFFNDKLLPIQKSKTGDKLIKAVFREIHDNLLTKYESDAHFDKILDNGVYNCVTASALYALSFEKLGIPHQLRSTTDHVYVIANPGPDQLLIETTDPVGGAFTFNEQFKKSYIEMLLKQKMISKQEYNETSLEALFQKNFYKADTIDFRQLIGYHYYNSGIELMTSENYDQGSNQLMKAYYLNNKKQVGHLLSLALSVIINKNFDIADSTSINLYFLFSHLCDETDYEFLYNKYLLSSEDLIMRKDELDKFQKISFYIFNFINDTVQRSKFQEHYYYACAYGYYTKKDYVSAYQNIVNSYCLNDKNLRVKALYDELNKNLFYYLTEDEQEGSLDSVMKKLGTVAGICGRVNSNKWKFQMMMVRAALQFSENHVKNGDEILSEAEKFAADNQLSDFDDHYIQMAYGGAKNYYFRQYQIPKAKEYLSRGLKLDPNNLLLKSDLARLNQDDDWKKTYTPYTKNPPPAPRTIIVKTPH